MPWPLRMITYAGILVLILLIYFGYRYFASLKLLNVKPLWFYGSLYFLLAGLFLAYPVAGHIEYWTQGSFSRTGYPNIVIYLYWYGVICMGVMLNWLILHDVLKPVVIRFSDTDPAKIRDWFSRGFLVIAGLTVMYTAVKMIWDTHRIVVNEITYSLPADRGPVNPLTIVHIADLHADKYTGREKISRYIRKVNEANPDIVIFAGDLISSGLDYVNLGADGLADINSTYGTWFVIGDHDYWSGEDEIASAVEERGIKVLQNENAIVSHGEMIIKITGVTELYSYRVDRGLLSELLNEKAGEQLHLLASHQASETLINEASGSGVHQLLAGHTHGGQIRVPLFFYPITAARAESPYVKGNWKFGNMLLNINSGLGFTLTPVRYNAPAQVTVIKVK
jgi:uncharacterized protein